jgi:excisionase family DNA binding protein
MTAHEFAAEVQVSVDTVRRWARTGVGPRPVRLGCRAVRYRRVDVDAWIATGSAA